MLKCSHASPLLSLTKIPPVAKFRGLYIKFLIDCMAGQYTGPVCIHPQYPVSIYILRSSAFQKSNAADFITFRSVRVFLFEKAENID